MAQSSAEAELGGMVKGSAELIGTAAVFRDLGMDLKEDADLLFIAEEGLKAEVPEPWKAYATENEDIYYCNTITG